MLKRDVEMIARIIKANAGNRRKLAEAFALELVQIAPEFDRLKFMKASGVVKLGFPVDMALDATPLRNGHYAVRPAGQLGTCGWSPIPWTVRFVSAKSPSEAIRKARARATSI